MNNILKIAPDARRRNRSGRLLQRFRQSGAGKGLHGQGLHGDGRRDHFDQGPESEILREMGP